MNFNEIRLPPTAIAEIYNKVLVDLNPENSPKGETTLSTPSEPVEYLGDNLKKVLVIVDYPGHAFLPEAQLSFLTNILKACQLNIADIAIVNTASRQTGFQHLKTVLTPQIVLFFGIHPSSLYLNLELEDFVVTAVEGISMVSAPQLEKLNQATGESKQLKSRLWVNLKQLFNV